MRVLLVLHGQLPAPGRPVSGGALRASHHLEALRGAGHEVVVLTRAQDAPGEALTYDSPGSLRALAQAAAPDAIVCVQPEEAPALEGLAPLCVDLYAPRLAEAAWEGATPLEATRTLRAVAAADHLLFSNTRQSWYYLGILALAGVDIRAPRHSVVPLVAPAGPPRQAPEEPVFLLAGVAWPWQDPAEGLRRAVAHLERRGRGRVEVVGGRPLVGSPATVDLAAQVPPGPRLRYTPPVAYEALLALHARCTAALDWMAPNPERALAVSFRQVDALGCGLPLLTHPHHALSDTLRSWDAGWVVDGEGLEAALDEALDQPEAVERKARQARALGLAEHSRDQAEAPLLAWVQDPQRRERPRGPLLDAAALAAGLAEARAQAHAARSAQQEAQAELALKRAEVERLTAQNQDLCGSLAHLSRAVDEVAGFRRETVRVLGARSAAAEEESEALARELADLRADLAKKDAELRAARREQERLNDALAAAVDEAQAAGDRLHQQGRVEDRLRQELRGLREALGRGPLARLRRS